MDATQLTLKELSRLAGIPTRTIRLYIQKGLLARPVGQRKAAYYTPDHLRQLLEIARLKGVGVSLRVIKDIMADSSPNQDIPCRPKTAGGTEVWSRIWIAPGLELHVDPLGLELNNKQVKRFVSEVLTLLDSVRGGGD